MGTGMATAGPRSAAEVADDSANAPATLPPLKDTPAVPDLEEPPALDKDEDEEGHHPQPQPHDHSHEEDNTPNGNGAQPAEKTGDEKTPPNAADADTSPDTRATSASNKRPPSEGSAQEIET